MLCSTSALLLPAPSAHFPSAMMQNTTPRGKLWHMPGDLVFATSSRGMPLDHVAMEARGACNPGSCENGTMETLFLADNHPQGTAQTADCTLLESFWERDLGFGLRGKLSDWHTSRYAQRGSQGMEQSTQCLCSPSALFQIPNVSHIGVYPLVRSPSFCNFHLEDTSRPPGAGD